MRRQREAEMSKPFMNEDFLLSGETARALYREVRRGFRGQVLYGKLPASGG